MNSQFARPALLCSVAPKVLVAAAALIVVTPGSALAQAQTAPTGAASVDVNSTATDMAEIVVTARRRSETLLETPLAITAMSSAAMEKKGVDSLMGVANYTPSLNITSFGNSTTNRAMQTVIIRGMVPGTTYNQTTTVFINGAPLAASGLIDGISDVAQVEIIKGPQSAYFGRSTFGGAVNIITKAPGDDAKVTVDATYGSYNWTDLKATVEGAILPGVLSARLTGRYYQTDGYYDSATPGYKYGAQESKNLLGEIQFTPTENLTVRAFGAFIETDDGYQSFVRFPRSTFNCSPSPGQSIICGTLPMQYPNSPNPAPLPQSFLDATRSPAAGIRYKDLGLDHGGSASEVRVGTLNITYDDPNSGLTFSSLTAANDFNSTVISDASNPGTAEAFRQLNDGRSYAGAFNQEFRIASDPTKRLRGLIGVNYSHQRKGNTGMGIAAPDYIFRVQPPATINRNNTYAAFASATFDLTPQIILNAEGRYQESTTWGYSRTLNSAGDVVEAKIPGLEDTTKEFLPRAIIQYKFAPGHQVFATYAKGANPGIFNTAFVTYSPGLQQYLSDLLGGGVAAGSEKITSYEVGYKGELFDGRLQLDVGAYFSQWRDQIIVQGLRIVNPALTGIPGTLATNMYSNQGATDLKGIEGNFYYRASRALTLSGGASINDTKILRYANTQSAQFLGYAPGTAPLNVFEGNQLAYGSKYSANISLDYAFAISGALDGYFHADAFYKSGQFGEPGNFYKTPDTKRVNLRVGANYESSKLELFVENVFDDRAYLSASPAFDQTDGNRPIAAAVLPTPRRIGVRFRTEY